MCPFDLFKRSEITDAYIVIYKNSPLLIYTVRLEIIEERRTQRRRREIRQIEVEG